MNNNGDTFGIFSDPLMIDYLKANETTIRYAVSRISAECELMSQQDDEAAPADNERSLRSITAMCCRLMQVSELYGFLSAVINKDEETASLEASAYIKGIAARCGASLGQKYSVRAETGEKLYIQTSEELLTFVLVGFIRSRAISGAEDILISCGEGDMSYISVAATASGKTSGKILDDFLCTHIEDTVRLFVENFAERYELTDEKLTIFWGKRRFSDAFDLSAPLEKYEYGKFSVYNIELSDLNEDNFV